MTLGKYLKSLRTERPKPMTQQDLARAASVDDSTISFLETGGKISADTLRSICKDGLKVRDDDWQMIRLLWLENQTEESVFKGALTKAREAMEIKESKATQDFLDKTNTELLKNIHVIDREHLRPVILEIFSNPKLLASLRQFVDLHRSFRN